jgi:hypothetical protein
MLRRGWARLSEMEREEKLASVVSDYLNRERRAHGPKSRELFKAEDLRTSLVWESWETMTLKSRDDNGRETERGKAKVRYESNNLFSVSEIRAFQGRYSGDVMYTPGREEEWHWDVFPPKQWPRPTLLGTLLERLNSRVRRALTAEEKTQLQGMVERVMADYLALDKTQRLIPEIDKAEAVVSQEWAKEIAMYTATFGGTDGDARPHD